MSSKRNRTVRGAPGWRTFGDTWERQAGSAREGSPSGQRTGQLPPCWALRDAPLCLCVLGHLASLGLRTGRWRRTLSSGCPPGVMLRTSNGAPPSCDMYAGDADEVPTWPLWACSAPWCVWPDAFSRSVPRWTGELDVDDEDIGQGQRVCGEMKLMRDRARNRERAERKTGAGQRPGPQAQQESPPQTVGRSSPLLPHSQVAELQL